ncbi:hypothetical protein AWL63_05790 [Sphingomonas panacis]|uniref:Uncharacterized protein n=1 Tax=Sphingomonas panacis TaxID=1560345 RepID=A0A1B3Z808_9SPHN|nr:hypothetical protein [Sphingomonas panacis]AOH83553.1 hypothetical protein AWL63_05790 [Sphingomonas panacis]
MAKSATDLMQDILVATTLDAFMALKKASGGLPNALLRDLNAVHANTTLADLPAEVQAAIAASVRDAFSRLLKEGYTVAPSRGAPPPPAPRSPTPPPRSRAKSGPPTVETRRPRPPVKPKGR